MRWGTSNSSGNVFLLEFSFQARESGDPGLRVFADPALVDEPDRDGVQEVELLPAAPARDHEIGLLQQPEVLHDAEARHGQALLERTQRLPVLLEELVEQSSPGRVAERLEHLIHVGEYR